MHFLVFCTIAALSTFIGVAGTRSIREADGSRTRVFLKRAALALLSVALAFELLGVLELASGQRVVRPEYAALLLAAATCTLVILKRLRPNPRDRAIGARFENRSALTLSARVALAVVACELAVTLGTTSSQYPRAFEGLAYHLPLAVHFVREHTLLPWDRFYPHTFPALASVVQGLFLFGLPERIASSANFVFAPVLLAGVYGTSRNLGAERTTAAIAACGMLSIPVIAFGLFEAGSDVAALSFVVAALFFATSDHYRLPLRASLVGALCGAAYAAKPSTLAASAAVALVLSAQSREFVGLAVRKRSEAAALFCVSFLALAGYWLLRNALLFGNPLYPVGTPALQRLFGWPMSEAFSMALTGQSQFWYVRRPIEWFVYPWLEFEHTGQSYSAHSGYGAFTAAILLPCYAFAGWRLRLEQTNRLRTFAVWAGALIVLAGWAGVERQPRYLIPIFAFLIPAAAYGINQSNRQARSCLQWIAVATITVMSGAIATIEIIGFGDRVIYSGMNERHLFYEYPPEVDHLPDGAVVLDLASRPSHYPLFGEGLRNRVISTPAAR